ncbi:hypothetical protein ACFWWB_38400 [Streptomyces sp. NPDC058690]|uniref:hypothetical protein n=1 Tax=Streptomyces sp. NPDC058690 TaxID=3346600 RepID=UPI00364B090E
MGEDRSGVQGRADPGREGVLDTFAEGQVGDAGAAELTACHHGRSVVDVWSAAPHPGTEMTWDPAGGPDPRWLPWSRAIHHAAGLPVGR